MNCIDQKFKDLKKLGKKAFIAFITAGDPNLSTTKDLVLAFEKSGVDIVELGVPFSDPLADGPTIQASSQRALTRHINLEKILNIVKDIRRVSNIPLALMTYYNPIFHMGDEKFVRKAVEAGVDGVIIPDLPPEEAKDLIALGRRHHLSTVFFISPTTTQNRMKKIGQASSGFIYYVSLTGVTGARAVMVNGLVSQIKLAKRFTKQPICVGFGVSNLEQVKSISKVADGVIVGSAIVNCIAKNAGKKNLVANVARFVRALSRGCE